MNRMLVLLLLAFCTLLARADTIRQVIESGIMQRLTESPMVDPSTTPRLVATFHKVKAHLNEPRLMLKVVEQVNGLALTANWTILVARGAETLSDAELEFIIAHEAGHMLLGHKERRIRAYERHIQGEVTEEKARIANARIGREMQQLSYRGEFEADRFAMKTMIELGRSKDDVINAFLGMSRTPDTATHPSTAKRIMNMKREGEPNE